MIAATDIERARAVRIEDEIKRRGIKLKRQSAELVGPCPMCGGRDRFAVNTRKQVWNCRRCEVGDDVRADVIGLVQLIWLVELAMRSRTLCCSMWHFRTASKASHQVLGLDSSSIRPNAWRWVEIAVVRCRTKATCVTTLVGDGPRKPMPLAKPEKSDGHEEEKRNLDLAEAIWRETSPLRPDAVAYLLC
jgi:Zinc-binding domain of primase-helicase